ncbi:conserved exported hypothetical protein [Cupriavidus necator]|uniref:Extra-cytoplasmic solute receptor n=1 Tax=Cupriavidus necator TaxID=106590 RepID=A0A1K0IFW5_CUPNE|nr:conserved exported hypothetical protein [Cupriavidus necator]
MNRRQFTISTMQAALGLSVPAWLPAAARASAPLPPAGYPGRVVHAVVPYPAGGVVDITIRTATDRMSLAMPQRILVENRPGADGKIGVEAVSRAEPDGYTLLAATPVLSVSESLYPQTSIRVRDFRAIGAVAAVPAIFVVADSVPARTLAEFVAWARERPGRINVPNPGTGSSIHLGQELFFEATGIKAVNIGYKGQPPSVPDLGQGQLHFALLSQSIALPLIKAGRVRALAANAGQRTQSLPEVPTIAEAGYPGVLVRSWYGLAAPARTPDKVIAYLSGVLQQAMATADVRGKLAGLDAEILALDAPAFGRLIAAEQVRWAALIKARNIQASA